MKSSEASGPGSLFSGLSALKISCTDADCENDLHCFKAKQRAKRNPNDAPGAEPISRGACRYCGTQLVDWPRIYCRDFRDVEYTVNALKMEYVRHDRWHTSIDEAAINHARRKGLAGLEHSAAQRLLKYLAPSSPVRDGRQTPWTGNVIYYAQHAMACCCRTCLEYWHAIPKGRPLTEDELSYLLKLIMRFITARLPGLTTNGEYVPRRMRKNASLHV